MKRVIYSLVIVVVGVVVFFALAPGLLESSMNKVERQDRAAPSAVSYTHLTLPTTPYV